MFQFRASVCVGGAGACLPDLMVLFSSLDLRLTWFNSRHSAPEARTGGVVPPCSSL